MTSRDKHGIFRHRGRIWRFFLLGVLLFNNAAYRSVALSVAIHVLGLVLVTYGVVLRLWAVGHAGTHTRSRRLQAPMLVTSGPYAYTRNPIYLGNFFIGLGLAAMSDSLVVIMLFVAIFWVVYRLVVGLEEEFLQRQFGEAYESYRRGVPRWLPRLRPWTRRDEGRFSINRLGKEYLTSLGTYALAGMIEMSKYVHRLYNLS